MSKKQIKKRHIVAWSYLLMRGLAYYAFASECVLFQNVGKLSFSLSSRQLTVDVLF